MIRLELEFVVHVGNFDNVNTEEWGGFLLATNPYSSVSISGYNSSPPPDDGSQTSANELTWAKHKDKLADPVKNRQDTIDTRLVTAFGKVINTDADENNLMGGSLAFTEKIFTIASGAITPTRSNVVLAAESGTTDTLDSMATGSVSDDCLMILSVDTGDTITINDAGGAAGQIHLVDSQDLILTGNDRLFLIRDGADWYEIARAVDSERVVQIVSTQTGAVATGTTLIPADDTIPVITEGVEYMTRTITPKSASNRLIIDVVFIGAQTVAGANHITVALFRDAVTDALAVATNEPSTSNIVKTISFRHIMTAPSTSEITFRVRSGTDQSATLTFNGAEGARLFGGVMASSITITEIGA